jgi:hypothetical protein
MEYLLAPAKADLAHGRWGRLFDEAMLPFGKRTAERLMAIANHPLLSNTTLYKLTKVPEPTLKNALLRHEGAMRPARSWWARW